MDKKAVVYIYTIEYYSTIKKNAFETVIMRWMKLEPIIQNEVCQKEKHQYSILTHTKEFRDTFKRIRDTKGIFHAKMGSIKDRNVMDPTEAEDIKKKWQEYKEELYPKKDLMTWITTMVWSLI